MLRKNELFFCWIRLHSSSLKTSEKQVELDISTCLPFFGPTIEVFAFSFSTLPTLFPVQMFLFILLKCCSWLRGSRFSRKSTDNGKQATPLLWLQTSGPKVWPRGSLISEATITMQRTLVPWCALHNPNHHWTSLQGCVSHPYRIIAQVLKRNTFEAI